MKRILFVTATIAVLSAGCATTPSDTSGIDVQRVAQVDRLARQRGVELHWVNYPQRKTPVVVEPILPTGT